ncbi:hypothetical protein K1719_004251 [Acacia pycnantha]|nr:hypothetical protein K1719_004251 [Acacia pycnantha]
MMTCEITCISVTFDLVDPFFSGSLLLFSSLPLLHLPSVLNLNPFAQISVVVHGNAASSPRTVEEIFKDYSARRAGVVRALTQGSARIN